jgi:hypothetical protein
MCNCSVVLGPTCGMQQHYCDLLFAIVYKLLNFKTHVTQMLDVNTGKLLY